MTEEQEPLTKEEAAYALFELRLGVEELSKFEKLEDHQIQLFKDIMRDFTGEDFSHINSLEQILEIHEQLIKELLEGPLFDPEDDVWIRALRKAGARPEVIQSAIDCCTPENFVRDPEL